MQKLSTRSFHFGSRLIRSSRWRCLSSCHVPCFDVAGTGVRGDDAAEAFAFAPPDPSPASSASSSNPPAPADAFGVVFFTISLSISWPDSDRRTRTGVAPDIPSPTKDSFLALSLGVPERGHHTTLDRSDL